MKSEELVVKPEAAEEVLRVLKKPVEAEARPGVLNVLNLCAQEHFWQLGQLSMRPRLH